MVKNNQMSSQQS